MTDIVRIGSEILVNTATEGSQVLPQITALANGGFVVTWSGSGASGAPGRAQAFAANGTKAGAEIETDSGSIAGLSNGGFVEAWKRSDSVVAAQLFAADGTKVGAEILADLPETSGHPQITALSNGGFVVTTQGVEFLESGTNLFVAAQVFAADGTKISSEILVNTTAADSVVPHAVTALSNGGFVVAWEDYHLARADGSLSAVGAQVFAANGSKIGSEILVNTIGDGWQESPKVTALPNGGFVVVWEDRGVEDGVARAQVFTANGIKVGPEIFVGDSDYPDIATLSNGGFVVMADLHSDIEVNVFAADGVKIGSETLGKTATRNRQITALSDGGFVVTWEDGWLPGGPIGDGDGSAIKAQAFAADGTRIGSEIIVNAATAGDQSHPAITALSDGGFVVTWTDFSQGVGGAIGDASSSAVKAQVFGVSSGGTAAHDFDGDGASDLLLRNTEGVAAAGGVRNGALVYWVVAGVGLEWSFGGVGDFFGDGAADFLVWHGHGPVFVVDVENGHTQYVEVAQLGSEWKFVGTGDFLGLGHDEFVIKNDHGAVVIGDAQNGQAQYTEVAALGSEWEFVGSGDFLGTGRDAFLIENKAGAVVVGDVQNSQAQYTQVAALGSEWKFVGTGDFLGLGHDAFLIKNDNGAVVVGDVQNGQAQYTQVGGLGDEWSFLGTGDYLGDGTADFVIENKAGEVFLGTIANGQTSYAQIGALGSEWSSRS